jgi:hypothetical protein
MTTSEFISHILYATNNGLTRSQALQLTDMAQTELLSFESLYTQVLPAPTLTTVAGTLTYTLPAGIRSVNGAWIESASDIDGRIPISFNAPMLAEDTLPLQVYFDQDPGDQIITLDAFKWFPRLLTENIALSIPAPFQTGALKSRVMNLWEESNFGNSVYWANRFEKIDNPAWIAYAGQGLSTHSGQIKNQNIYG